MALNCDIMDITLNRQLEARETDIFAAIGNTPLVELKVLNGDSRVRILGKLEGNNPGGSVKDRPAYYMIKKAEESGALAKGRTILEPTSGNTGIALAMIGAAKGYAVKLVMPGCVSVERSRILEAFGAEVILTPAEEGTDGAIREASGSPARSLTGIICPISSRTRTIALPTTRRQGLKYCPRRQGRSMFLSPAWELPER